MRCTLISHVVTTLFSTSFCAIALADTPTSPPKNSNAKSVKIANTVSSSLDLQWMATLATRGYLWDGRKSGGAKHVVRNRSPDQHRLTFAGNVQW
jgi:hypothetical protein